MSPEAAPLDLRLAPAAALSWVLSWWLVARGPTSGLIVLLVLLVMAGAAGRWLGRRPRARHRARVRDRAWGTVLITAAIALAVSGSAMIQAHDRAAASEPILGDVEVSMRVDAEPQDLANPSRSRVRIDATLTGVIADGAPEARSLPVVVVAAEDWRSVPVGTTWLVSARAVPTDPGDRAALLLIIESSGELVAEPGPLARTVGTLRDGLSQASYSLAPQARGLVPGITLGDTRNLPADLEDDLRTVALTHITAVSGAHVAIILGVILALLWWAPTRVRVAVGALVLVGFVMLVYPSGSVVRAATMGGVVLLGLATGRPRASVPALLATVVVLLAIDPWLARDFGFVLSVVATGGLLLLAQPIAARLSGAMPYPVALMISIPVAAQLVCAPIILLLAPGVATHGVVANALAAPAVPPATILGVLATCVSPLWPAGGEWLAQCAGWFTAWIATVATTTAGLPLATLPWPEGGRGALILVGAMAALLALVWTRRRT